MSMREMARKYVACTSAMPAIPSQAIFSTSSRAIRKRAGANAASPPSSSRKAAAERSCESLAADIPSSSR